MWNLQGVQRPTGRFGCLGMQDTGAWRRRRGARSGRRGRYRSRDARGLPIPPQAIEAGGAELLGQGLGAQIVKCEGQILIGGNEMKERLAHPDLVRSGDGLDARGHVDLRADQPREPAQRIRAGIDPALMDGDAALQPRQSVGLPKPIAIEVAQPQGEICQAIGVRCRDDQPIPPGVQLDEMGAVEIDDLLRERRQNLGHEGDELGLVQLAVADDIGEQQADDLKRMLLHR